MTDGVKKRGEKMRHGTDKCRVCENYLRGIDACKFCSFEWATEYPPCDDWEWDILDLDDEIEWSFLQIQDRLKFKGIDCVMVLNWYDANAILIMGCMAYASTLAQALGVHEECIVQDLQYGISIINLFKEKWLRGEI